MSNKLDDALKTLLNVKRSHLEYFRCNTVYMYDPSTALYDLSTAFYDLSITLTQCI
jgi:hypothetical protein